MESLTLVIIEDEESHFDLMKRAIARKFPYASVYHFQEANTCIKRFDEIMPTIILIDYLLPDMNGIEFLEALNQRNIDIPVIMITGHGNENIAVRAMKSGAKDYLVKSGDFFTLLPSIIDNVIRERKLEQSLRKSEEKYRIAVGNATIGIVVTHNGYLKLVNPHAVNLSGYSEKELTSRPFVDFVHPDDRAMVMEHHIARIKGEEAPEVYLFKIINKNGKTIWLENKGVLITWEGNPATLNFLADVTERKQSEDLVHNLSHMLMQAQERERQMISYELHDSIGQNLSTLKIG
ncbi:MAG: PAS domain S-box protein, partial [Deltaproteobacteria bacterium]|nr:PAS domain S-box protein [Deltaproteobacteria bacterium]